MRPQQVVVGVQHGQGPRLFQVWWPGEPWQAGQVRAFGPAPLLQAPKKPGAGPRPCPTATSTHYLRHCGHAHASLRRQQGTQSWCAGQVPSCVKLAQGGTGDCGKQLRRFTYSSILLILSILTLTIRCICLEDASKCCFSIFTDLTCRRNSSFSEFFLSLNPSNSFCKISVSSFESAIFFSYSVRKDLNSSSC